MGENSLSKWKMFAKYLCCGLVALTGTWYNLYDSPVQSRQSNVVDIALDKTEMREGGEVHKVINMTMPGETLWYGRLCMCVWARSNERKAMWEGVKFP